MRRFYQNASAYCEHLARKSLQHFAGYIALTRRFAPAGARILDIGAGAGQAARAFAESGMRPIATDVSPLFLAAARRADPALQALAADAARLPFRDGSFDVVAGCELVEHLAEPAAVLDELVRVTRPGGFVILRSPALASPIWPLMDLPNLLRGKGGRPPHYANFREARLFFARNMARTVRIALRRHPTFERREPDLSAAVEGGDADAVYWSSPIEIARHLRRRGMVILQKAESGRRFSAPWILAKIAPWLSPTLAIVARRPGRAA